MTVLQTSQVVAEVLRQPTAPNLQSSQVAVEVLQAPSPKAQVSQLVVEVLRTNGTETLTTSLSRLLSLDYAFGAQPFVQLATGTINTQTLDYAFGAQPFVASLNVTLTGLGGGSGGSRTQVFTST